MTREEIKTLPEHRVKDAVREDWLEKVQAETDKRAAADPCFVPFTQYVRPNGERRAGGFVRSSEVATEARKFIAAGGSFAAEILPGGSVAISADFDFGTGEREDIVMLIVKNGPGIGDKVDKLVAMAMERSGVGRG